MLENRGRLRDHRFGAGDLDFKTGALHGINLNGVPPFLLLPDELLQETAFFFVFAFLVNQMHVLRRGNQPHELIPLNFFLKLQAIQIEAHHHLPRDEGFVHIQPRQDAFIDV